MKIVGPVEEPFLLYCRVEVMKIVGPVEEPFLS